MRAVVVYESLTGNTRKAAGLIAAEFNRRGVPASAFAINAIDYQALEDADLVVVGSWTDGLFFFGQRPGRAGRLQRMPFITGKKSAVFCTFAIDQGHVLDKLVAIVEGKGADVIGGLAIRRDKIGEGAIDFVGRVLDAVPATS
jgi:hypothetical protein